MDIVRSWRDTPPALKGAVLAIGNFDGVHRGHQAVLNEAKRIAAAEGRPAGAVVFEPHPREFFAPDQPFFRLTPLPVKLELLEALGLDQTFVITFDKALSSLSSEAFATDVVGGSFGASHVVVGYDFTYGKGRTGSVEQLTALGKTLGFGVDIVAPVTLEGGVTFSSSTIREHLRKGEVREAAEQLGYWWRARGEVKKGAGRGKGLGFPTLNYKLAPGQDVSHGIYAMRVHHAGERHHAAGYVGPRPTFGPGESDAGGLSPRLLGRPLWRAGRGRVHRFYPSRPCLRDPRRACRPDGGGLREGPRCATCRRRRRPHAALYPRGGAGRPGTGLWQGRLLERLTSIRDPGARTKDHGEKNQERQAGRQDLG